MRPPIPPKEEIFGSEFPDITDPVAVLRQVCERSVRFCLDYPTFRGSGLALMQPRASELPEYASGAALARLGRAAAATRGPLERVFVIGAERLVFAIDGPDFMANRVSPQLLGYMLFACVGVGVRESGPGAAETFDRHRERVRQVCAQESLPHMRATAGASA